MKTIKLKGKSGVCKILVGERFENIGNYCDLKKTIIVTDSNVNKIYSKKFMGLPTIVIDPGEDSKTLQTAQTLCRKLLEFGADRKTFLLCVGGGVVCDLGGFVASTFMRGLDFAYVPTTLLAQADASIGGKNGVNLDHYKNIIGTFTQPKFCIVDIDFLASLPESQISSGLAEIIKHGIIAKPQILDFFEKNSARIFSHDKAVLEELVFRSIEVKVSIVSGDELEAGGRALLNFGHTIGHAVEKLTGLDHGKAISIGMAQEALLSEKSGFSHKDTERIISILKLAKLPTLLEVNPKKLVEAMKKDKKNIDGKIRIVLLEKIGSANLVPVAEEEILKIAG